MREVRWERMFRDELEHAFEETPLLYLPYGICEPHGPHNALGLDGLKAHGIACHAAQTHGGIVAPVSYWHIHELGGEGAWSFTAIGEVARPWLTAIPPWIFFKNLCYHVRMADAHGFHAAILVTGHYGPLVEDFRRVIGLVQPYVGARLYGLPDSEANERGFGGDGGETGDHAGKVETSLLWALDPECVDISRLTRLPRAEADRSDFALGHDAYLADRRVGERMVLDEITWLGAKGRELLVAYKETPEQRRLRTFDEVETLWEHVVRPELPTFRTMQLLWEGQQPVPQDSVWFANWAVPDRG